MASPFLLLFAYVGPAAMIRSPQPPGVNVSVVKNIALDGDGDENVLSSLSLGDVNGDGKKDWILTNGTVMAKVYDHNGAKLWEVRNDAGRGNADPWHPWATGAWDLDGDGLEEVIHFWQLGGATTAPVHLVVRDGLTGAIRDSYDLDFLPLPTPSGSRHKNRGQLAVAYLQPNVPSILTIEHDNGGEASVFTFNNNTLVHQWTASIPGGGHYIWPYDLDGDGVYEHVFFGKYVYDNNGTRLWTLPGYGPDHVDSLAAADIDPLNPGYEVVTVGFSGSQFYDLDQRVKITDIPQTTITNPQQLQIGEFDPGTPGLEIMIRERSSEPLRRAGYFDLAGTVLAMLAKPPELHMPRGTMDLDGNRAADELITAEGQILGGLGNILVAADWYIGEQTLTPAEQALHKHWRWNPHPIPADVLDDSREEIVAHGRHALVVGKNTVPWSNPPPAYQSNRAYWMSRLNRFRGAVYFDFRSGY